MRTTSVFINRLSEHGFPFAGKIKFTLMSEDPDFTSNKKPVTVFFINGKAKAQLIPNIFISRNVSTYYHYQIFAQHPVNSPTEVDFELVEEGDCIVPIKPSCLQEILIPNRTGYDVQSCNCNPETCTGGELVFSEADEAEPTYSIESNTVIANAPGFYYATPDGRAFVRIADTIKDGQVKNFPNLTLKENFELGPDTSFAILGFVTEFNATEPSQRIPENYITIQSENDLKSYPLEWWDESEPGDNNFRGFTGNLVVEKAERSGSYYYKASLQNAKLYTYSAMKKRKQWENRPQETTLNLEFTDTHEISHTVNIDMSALETKIQTLETSISTPAPTPVTPVPTTTNLPFWAGTVSFKEADSSDPNSFSTYYSTINEYFPCFLTFYPEDQQYKAYAYYNIEIPVDNFPSVLFIEFYPSYFGDENYTTYINSYHTLINLQNLTLNQTSSSITVNNVSLVAYDLAADKPVTHDELPFDLSVKIVTGRTTANNTKKVQIQFTAQEISNNLATSNVIDALACLYDFVKEKHMVTI